MAGGDGESSKYQTQPSIGQSNEGDSAEKTPGQNNTVRRFKVVPWSRFVVPAPVCTVGQTGTSDNSAIFTRHILLPSRRAEDIVSESFVRLQKNVVCQLRLLKLNEIRSVYETFRNLLQQLSLKRILGIFLLSRASVFISSYHPGIFRENKRQNISLWVSSHWTFPVSARMSDNVSKQT